MERKYIVTRIGYSKRDGQPYTILCPLVEGEEDGVKYGYIDTRKDKGVFEDGHMPIGTVKAMQTNWVK